MVRPCAKYARHARLNCEHRQKIPTAKRRRIFYVGLPTYARRGLFGLGLCRNKYKRAVIARFRNVADGNISRLRNAQAFHAAVKRPPYFTFARQRRHFTAGRSVSGSPSPRLRGQFFGLVLCRNKYKRAIIARFRNVAEGNIKAYIRCCNPNTSNEARRSCRFRR